MEYEEMMKIILVESKKERDLVEDLIKLQLSKFKGLINKEGAIYLVAKDLKVNLYKNENKNNNKKEEIKMNEIIKNKSFLRPGEFVSFQGRVGNVQEIKTITTKTGEVLDLLNFRILDERGESIRVTAWREQAKLLLKQLKIDDLVLIKDVKVQWSEFRNESELSMNSRSTVNVVGNDNELDFSDKSKEIKTALKNKEVSQIRTIVKEPVASEKVNTIIEILQEIKHSLSTITSVMTRNIKPELKTASKGNLDPDDVQEYYSDDEEDGLTTFD